MLKGCIMCALIYALLVQAAASTAIANDTLPRDSQGRPYFEFGDHRLALEDAHGKPISEISLRFPDSQDGHPRGNEHQRRFWSYERIVREYEQFKQRLREASELHLMQTTTFKAKDVELIDRRSGEKLKRFEPLSLTVTYHVSLINIGLKLPQGRQPYENLTEQMVRSGFAGVNEQDMNRRDLRYDQSQAHGFNVLRLRNGSPIAVLNWLDARYRLFPASRDLFVSCDVFSCQTSRVSNSGIVKFTTEYSSSIHIKHWIDIDADSHKYVNNLFLSPIPEGLQ